MPHMNPAGLSLLKKSEGCLLFAYDDHNDKRILPGDEVIGTLTIGWGHTGPDVHPGQVISPSQADLLLIHDLQNFEIAVNNMVTRSATPNQFSAMVDFAYNEGSAALHGSTLLKRFNAGDFDGAADQFLVWDVNSPGLQVRRKAERALFLTPERT